MTAMKKISLWAMSGALACLLFGCKKQPLDNLTQEESRIYITDHDSTVDFSGYHTFSISDSVALIENGKASKQLNEAATAYIQAVVSIMEANGFTEVTKEDHPDVGITVNRIISTTTGVISYDDYWNYYDAYWDPYYWGYPGYGYYLPYSYAIYQIREGAVSIDMVDLKHAEENKDLKVIWTGLIRGSGIYSQSVADSQVKALFDQSPYLKTN